MAQRTSVHLNQNKIAGAVRSSNGPEAGVCVIAETTDLPQKFTKIVVTDDQRRYLLPDLPGGQLNRMGTRLWTRAKPSQILNATVVAPNARALPNTIRPAIGSLF